MYVAVKGGEDAIRNAHALLARRRRGDPGVPEIGSWPPSPSSRRGAT